MASNVLKIALMFTGVNLTANLFGSLLSNMDKVSTKAGKINHAGKTMLTAGGGVLGATVAGVMATARAYEDLEAKQVRFKNSLLQSDGSVDRLYTTITKQAIQLGNILPGTTGDMLDAARALHDYGMSSEIIAGGGLKAATYLGSVLGADYTLAAEAVARTGNALNVASKDMVAYADVVQRLDFAGLKLADQQFAWARVGGSIKALGVEGIDAAKKIAPLLIMLNRKGMSGEIAGSAFTDMVNRGNLKGYWKTTEEMVTQLESLKTLPQQQRDAFLTKVFGQGESLNAAKYISDQGMAGYQKIQAELAKQASLQQRAKESLGTMQAAFEGLGGTVTNASAAIGESFAPEIKQLTSWLNDVASSVQDWTKEHRTLVRWITFGALAFGLFLTVGGALALAMGTWTTVTTAYGVATAVLSGGFTKLRNAVTIARMAMALFGITSKVAMASTGIGLLIVAAVLIYEHWDKIKTFFTGLWTAIKPHVQPLLDFFSGLWQKVVDLTVGVRDFFASLGGARVPAVPSGTFNLRSMPRPVSPASSGSGTVNYAPTINMQGSASRDDLRKELDRHSRHIAGMVERQQQRQARRTY